MPHPSAKRHAGFTLVELLLAAALGAMLLLAAASAAGRYSMAMAQLEADAGSSLEDALARVHRDVRYAWSVDVPARNRLLVTGPDQLVTEYEVVGDSLIVTRPDGSSGALVSGLAALTFQADRVQRLRSGRSTSVAATMASRAAPALSVWSASALAATQACAISFTGGSDAGARSVAGVGDRYTQWQPTSIELPVAAVGTGTMTFTLYRAFGPMRAEPRPGSSPIASWTQSLAGLPAAVVLAAPPLVVRTLYAVPAVSVPINIPSLPSPLEPGVTYTLVVTVSSGSSLVFASASVPAHTDQMLRNAAGTWQAMALLIPYTLRANGTCTTTQATDVVTQVRTSLQSAEGQTHVGSACVWGQVLAEDPWLGVVPGELPAGP